jgi:hypothetical protein
MNFELNFSGFRNLIVFYLIFMFGSSSPERKSVVNKLAIDPSPIPKISQSPSPIHKLKQFKVCIDNIQYEEGQVEVTGSTTIPDGITP